MMTGLIEGKKEIDIEDTHCLNPKRHMPLVPCMSLLLQNAALFHLAYIQPCDWSGW